uniref:hypothetical protein n=1 Tax=Prevotella sp. TaxID=59823 RepID=UPI003FF04DC3
MKKKYIQPNVSVSFVVVESLLLDASGSNGIGPVPGDFGYGGAKKHDFTDDSFDTAWPKGKSPWED